MSGKKESELIKEAARALSAGRLVAFPTETVYGLGADASNPEALKRLYEVKGRPTSHPVIVHIRRAEDAEKWCSALPESARILGERLWPGPLTLVLKKAKYVPEQVTGGQDTVALRVPRHPVALALLSEFGSGIAAPSANKFGRLSPTTAEDVRAEFGNEIALVLDGGPSEVGIESTIVDLSGTVPRILRPGMIKSQTIFELLKQNGGEQEIKHTPRVPGSLPSHYAPRTALTIASPGSISELSETLKKEGKKVALLSFTAAEDSGTELIRASKTAEQYAHDLYGNLRRLDSLGYDLIIAEDPPETPEWEGIRDRLMRAAGSPESKEECDGS